jgi:hypothetical protein
MLGFRLGGDGKAVRGSRRTRWPAMALALAVGAGLLGVASSGALASASTAKPAAREAAVNPSSGMLNQVLPRRVLDTRTTTGGHHGKLASGATMRLAVLGHGIPGAGVSAVLVNVTAVNGTSRTGYLTLFATGVTQPTASTLNDRGAAAIANQALVPLGSDGTISIFNSAGQTDVIVDIVGWVGSHAGAGNGQTTTTTPARILDTRTTNGGHHAPLLNGKSLTLQVEGAGGIPATGVSAVYANITALPTGNAGGYLTAYPSGTSQPLSSAINFPAGGTTANLALLKVSGAGAITITNHSAGANVIVDIAGWISGGSVTTDAGIQATQVTRILDTRSTLGGHKAPVGPNASVSVRVLGVGGVPSAGVAAVVVHVTGVSPTSATYLSAFATGYPAPSTSTLNLPEGVTVSSTTIVPVGPAGKVSIHNEYGTLNVVLDVQGWIAAPVLKAVPPLASALGLSRTTPLTTSDGARAEAILTNANRYAVTTWKNGIYPALIGAPMKSEISPDAVNALTATEPETANAPGAASAAASVNTTDSVRRLSMEAFSLATSIATGAYNPNSAQAATDPGTGVPTSTATSFTIQIIGKVVSQHLTSTPVSTSGGWGATSESQIDSAYIGTAAWLLWPDLSAQVQSEVTKMVYFEAAWGMGFPIQFYANKAGTVLQPGDTGSDPDSWDPMPVQLALVMFPNSPMAPVWANTVVRDAIVAWSRPSDDTSGTVVNGATVASWINSGGSNVRSGGDLYNHNRIAPDYSSLIYQNMEDVLLTSLAGTSAPDASTALTGPVYNAYTTVMYNPESGHPVPAGDTTDTVYPPLSAKSSAIYYPQGCDWGLGQEIPYALADAQTAAFGVDTGTGTPTAATAESYESLHAGAELAMQAKNSNGSTYGEYPSNDTNEYIYVGREEHTAQLAAQLYLTEYVRDDHLFSLTSSTYWLAP